jgi:predicted transcriptional regulator
MASVTISDAEWQVMNLLWQEQPLTAQEVIAALSDKNGWSVVMNSFEIEIFMNKVATPD